MVLFTVIAWLSYLLFDKYSIFFIIIWFLFLALQYWVLRYFCYFVGKKNHFSLLLVRLYYFLLLKYQYRFLINFVFFALVFYHFSLFIWNQPNLIFKQIYFLNSWLKYPIMILKDYPQIYYCRQDLSWIAFLSISIY